MLIFWDQRLVFLATPKAGSTAVEVALEPLASLAVQRPPEMKHADAAHFHRHIHPWLQEMTADHFTTVALMREPVDWLGSWYRFRRREDLLDENASTRNMSFDDFANAYCETPQPGFANVGAQSRFLTPPGRQPVDRIFRYEDIGTFVDFLEDRLNCEIILPRLNVSPEADLALRPETLVRLQHKMAEDLALYSEIGGGTAR